MKVCGQPGCAELCDGPRCPAHTPEPFAGSDRRARLPSDWPATRRRILDRDHGRCRWPTANGTCGQPANQVDHIEPGDDHSDANLWALCADHHSSKTGSEANAARTAPGRRRGGGPPRA